MVHALAVPPDNSGQVEQHAEQVEEIAVRIATAWEQERGTAVQDVSKPALARVWNCATPDPILVRVRNPFDKLLANERASATYAISPKSLMDAAEPT